MSWILIGLLAALAVVVVGLLIVFLPWIISGGR